MAATGLKDQEYLEQEPASVDSSVVWEGFPDRNAGDRRDSFYPWVGKIPGKRAWQPTPVFLPGESQT